MSTDINEQISSLIDGELSETDETRTIQELVKDPDLLKKWERYQLIGEVIKGKKAPLIDSDLLSRVKEAIAED